jgi:hypothetical protein
LFNTGSGLKYIDVVAEYLGLDVQQRPVQEVPR